MNIQINQLGYTPAMQKVAVMHGRLADEMHIVDAAGHTVMTIPVIAQPADIWGDRVVQVDFTALAIALGAGEDAPTIALGSFIQAVINFFLIAICVFIFVKFVNKLRKPKVEAPKPAPRLCPFCKSAIADDATRCPHCTSQLN